MTGLTDWQSGFVWGFCAAALVREVARLRRSRNVPPNPSANGGNTHE